MTEIVINTCHGGFELSEAGMRKYAELKGFSLYIEPFGDSHIRMYFNIAPEDRSNKNDGRIAMRDIERTDPALIQTIKDLGSEANGSFSELKIVEIPNGIGWSIHEYGGMERVVEHGSNFT